MVGIDHLHAGRSGRHCHAVHRDRGPEHTELAVLMHRDSVVIHSDEIVPVVLEELGRRRGAHTAVREREFAADIVQGTFPVVLQEALVGAQGEQVEVVVAVVVGEQARVEVARGLEGAVERPSGSVHQHFHAVAVHPAKIGRAIPVEVTGTVVGRAAQSRARGLRSIGRTHQRDGVGR